MIYAWQQSAWQNLTAHWQNLHHAWLFLGKAHTGKNAFARHFAQALLCENPSDAHEACGTCPSCHLFLNGNHPDFYTLSPDTSESDNLSGSRKLAQIKIDAVRAILEPLNQSSVRGGRRVVLISPAESLNVQAANALLKILEEPPQSVVFLLIANSSDRLLPTIKSRCRLFTLPAPSRERALQFLRDEHVENAENLLAFHSNAPLFERQPENDALREILLQWLANPRLLTALDFAATFDKQKQPLANLLDWLQKWLIDVALAQQKIAPLFYPHHAENSQKIAQKIAPDTIFSLSGSLKRLYPYGLHSLNVKMQTEFLLTEYLTSISQKSN